MSAARPDDDDDDATARAERVAEAMQLARVGDVQVGEQWQADAARYIAGEITADELVAITRARYGLT